MTAVTTAAQHQQRDDRDGAKDGQVLNDARQDHAQPGQQYLEHDRAHPEDEDPPRQQPRQQADFADDVDDARADAGDDDCRDMGDGQAHQQLDAALAGRGQAFHDDDGGREGKSPDRQVGLKRFRQAWQEVGHRRTLPVAHHRNPGPDSTPAGCQPMASRKADSSNDAASNSL